MAQTWWGTEKNPSQQLRKELAAMGKHFSRKKKFCFVEQVASWDKPFWIYTTKLQFHRREGSNENMFWLITFQMVEQDKKTWSREYVIKISYTFDHPFVEPRPLVVSGVPAGDGYGNAGTNADGTISPCLHAHSGAATGWDPNKSTAATFALWTIEWIRAYLYTKKGHIWPSNA